MRLDSGESEALRLTRDLDVASVTSDDVVVANHAFVMEAADAGMVLGSESSGGFGFTKCATEALAVAGQEAGQGLVGSSQIVGSGET